MKEINPIDPQLVVNKLDHFPKKSVENKINKLY